MTAYEQGFITKCAEYGVDGQALLTAMAKQAEWMEKKAQIAKFLGSLMSRGTRGLGNLIGGRGAKFGRKLLGYSKNDSLMRGLGVGGAGAATGGATVAYLGRRMANRKQPEKQQV